MELTSSEVGHPSGADHSFLWHLPMRAQTQGSQGGKSTVTTQETWGDLLKSSQTLLGFSRAGLGGLVLGDPRKNY